MNFKIVSGGQTGVDRAGLEAAIALGLPYGGWVPKGRLAEDGVVPLKYVGMQEHTSSNYAVRTKANVRDSDATLIIAPNLPLSRGTMLTLRTAERLSRPHHVACLGAANAMDETMSWLQSFQPLDRPLVLNIAGPRESGAPGIQERATEFLCQLLAADLHPCSHRSAPCGPFGVRALRSGNLTTSSQANFGGSSILSSGDMRLRFDVVFGTI